MKPFEFEKRFYTEIRASEDSKLLVGYAASFNSLSHDLGGFREIIKPGAFDRTLKENPDVLALVEHDTAKVLARTTNGTLRIVPDELGLRVEIDPANTSYGRDVVELVKRGDVAGMSFCFRVYEGGESLDLSSNPPIRTLQSVELREVSVVVNPAYPATEVSLRALEQARGESVRLQSEWRRKRLQLAEIF
jgi:HK97 family phage prohead protease